ncbi:MAG TPA: sigma-70 family RNA polymerase sigma factor [Pseudomonadales bacterium]|nr:sigma-70 family RNA polymerase sigma factor [Pseudomonadales bacterium]
MAANPPNDALSSREARLAELIRSALTGDAAAYKTFLTEASGHVRGYLKRRLQRTADIEDLVQEVLLAVHNKRHTYDTARPVTSWLFAIAQYKLIDHLRRNRHDAQTGALDDDYAANEPDADALAADRDLERLLDTLPERQRLPIRHVKIEGLSVAETSRLTGISESAVKVGIHRGLKALAARIRDLR